MVSGMSETSMGRLQKIAAWRCFRRALVPVFFVLVMFVGAGYARRSFETRDSLEAFTEYLDGRITSLMDQFVSAGMTGPYYTDHAVLGQESIRKLYTPAYSVDVSLTGIPLFSLIAE